MNKVVRETLIAMFTWSLYLILFGILVFKLITYVL